MHCSYETRTCGVNLGPGRGRSLRAYLALMVCCLIGAFLLGIVFRAARWTGRSVKALFGGKPSADIAPAVPTPVYELPDYLRSSFDEAMVDRRVREPV